MCIINQHALSGLCRPRATRNSTTYKSSVAELFITTLLQALRTVAETQQEKVSIYRKSTPFEVKTYRRPLRIPWTANRTNDSVLQEMGTDRQLLKSVMERKLRYFGHIMRRPGECLEKTVIQGCIQGSRPRGRPARSWINDILEATNCTLGQLLRLTEDRQAWREMVHSASNHQH